MQVLEIRPARVSAALVEIGDMLVSSPIGENGPRPPRWIGAVTEHVIVEDEAKPAAWRIWRIRLVSGEYTETAKIPADGWVWVHLPSSDLPAPRPQTPAWAELSAGMMDVAQEKDAELADLLEEDDRNTRPEGAD